MSKNKKRALSELGNEQEILQCAAEFNMVGDPTRLKICYLLCRHEELSVGDIAETVGVSISAVSHTLKKLKEARVVEDRREFRYVYYRLVQSPFAKFLTTRFKTL